MLNPKTNERELAYIVHVTEIKELPGYDHVHYVKILGWWCVASKDLKAGDLGIYFEIDSVLPRDDVRFSFMEKRNYRVKTQKMCRVTSQGLVLPLSSFPELHKAKEGDFVTKKLRVTQWEDRSPAEMPRSKSDAWTKAQDRHKRFFKNPVVKFFMRFGAFRWLAKKIFCKKKDRIKWPEWLPKTNSERVQNVPDLFNHPEVKWVASEKCVAGKTDLLTNKGLLQIRKIVNQKLPVSVACFNEDSQVVEFRKIVDYHRVGQTDKNHYKIGVGVRGKGNRPKFVHCTEDHKFLTPHGWVEAQNLKQGDVVYHFIESEYPQVLKEVVLGSLLGDSCIVHNGEHITVSFCNGEKQKDYIDEKFRLAGKFSTPMVQYTTGYGSVAYRFALKSNLWFYDYARKHCLVNGKTMLTKQWMDDITPISLAFWYMDDGSFLNRENPSVGDRICLNTQAYTTEECEMLQGMLRRFGIDSTLHQKSCYKGNVISIGVDGTKRFCSLIAPYVLPSMHYKLPKSYENIPYVLDKIDVSDQSGMVETDVLSVEKLPPKSLGNFMFDVTVEGNHNYFADGILVHNCDGMSSSYILDEKDTYMVASHNVIVFSDKVKGSESIADGNAYIATNVWLEMSDKYDVKTKLHQLKKKHGLKTVAIQGETYGDRIQRRAYGLKNNAHALAVFHIWFDGHRLDMKRMVEICDEIELPHVHIFDWEMHIPGTVEELVAKVDSCKSAIDGGMIEGFVLYSQDGMMNYKCVSPSFLLKYHG